MLFNPTKFFIFANYFKHQVGLLMKKILQLIWGNLIVRNILFMIMAGMLLFWGILHWLDSYTRHGTAIVVPDVRSLQVADAEPLLKNKSLRFEVVDSVYSQDVKPGAVVEQLPEANSKVKENRIIYLTVNARNRQMVAIPDVEELSQRQAVATLVARGFTVDSVQYVDYEYKDLVINIKHRNRIVHAGDKLVKGSNVVVLVGNGNAAPSTDEAADETGVNELSQEWLQ